MIDFYNNIKLILKEFKMKSFMKKKLFFLFVLAVFACFSTFAAGETSSTSSTGLGALKTIFGTVYWFFSSTYMLVICTVGLVWVAIRWITNRGEPQVVKDLAPKAGAMLIIGGASAICNLFFKPEGSFSVTSLTSGSDIFSELK